VALVSGAGGKAFCAGGDITALYKGGKGEGDATILSEFPANEYLLDYAMTTMKPY
jgi:enoyl-CoA hydratase/carnithine racemase